MRQPPERPSRRSSGKDFHILTAGNARAALAVLDDHGVDLVTLDLKLPDRSGSDLLHDIKRAHAEIEVIMVTAYGSLQSAMDCIRHGAAGFLLKPFNASELLAISLQTAQKKLRLDQLRPVLTNSATLWGPEPACTKAWESPRRELYDHEPHGLALRIA